MATLEEKGYDGPLSLEIFNPDYQLQPPVQLARRGAATLRALVEETLTRR